MRAGKLLAMDTPAALKRDLVSGLAWDVAARPLLLALAALQAQPGVLRVALAGDALRALAEPGVSAAELQAALAANGILGARVEAAQPTLEDVFLALAG